MLPSSPFRRALPALIVAALALAVFLPSAWSAEFAYDDARFILQNPHVVRPRGASDWLALLYDPRTVDPVSPTGIVRPLRTLEFALDRALFGLSPTAFHLHSIAWHVLTSVLVVALLRALGCGRAAATGGAALFAVHPMQVESVVWISSRCDVAMGACTLGALLLAMRSSGRDRYLVGSLVLGALAMLYKETGVVLPLLVFAVRLARPRDGPPGQVVRSLRAAVPYVLLSGVYVLYRAVVQVGETTHVISNQLGDSTGGTFATMFRAFFAYLGFVALPVRPAIDWYFAPSTSLAQPDVVACLAVHVAIIVGAVLIRRRQPLVAVAACLFYFPLLPVANWPFQLGIATAERFLYLSLVAIAVLVAWACDRLAGRTLLPAALVVVACGILSAQRAADWRNDDTLMTAAYEHGSSPRAYAWRSSMLQAEAHSFARAGRLPEATTLRARALDDAHTSLRLWYSFERTRNDDNEIVVSLHVDAADLCLALGRDVEALWHADQAILRNERLSSWSHVNRAVALIRVGRGPAAYRALTRALELGLAPEEAPVSRVFVDAAILAEHDGLCRVSAAACRAALTTATDESEMRRALEVLKRVETRAGGPPEEGVREQLNRRIRTGAPKEWRAAADAIGDLEGSEADFQRAVCAEEAGDDAMAEQLFIRWLADHGASAETDRRERAEHAVERLQRGCPSDPTHAGRTAPDR